MTAAHYRYRFGPGNPASRSGRWEVHCACGLILEADTARKASNAGDRHMADMYGPGWNR